ncbi:GreA/GreB family elongation factor [Chitinophaga agri]|uniref:GreA/GreB family elongation factor n=1 Tax=Chitinophaga agri TaxID=2703787 RepID=A0A6B9ZF81_9BACT|nr:GreA/GreB family elongation factor [Chitinophaga agri]QHS60171.1 GreA/GreB family elongation factor [Chitinophaga agri]
MTGQEMIAFKNRLKQAGELLIKQRIAMTKAAIDNAQEAANNEGKSSAGDKYETGRAMGHLEKDMYARQQAENLKELDQLQKINTATIYIDAQPGALVRCAEYSFFIAAGLGKQLLEHRTVFFLSPYAPLAKVLLHKKAGERFLFNKKEIEILEVS